MDGFHPTPATPPAPAPVRRGPGALVLSLLAAGLAAAVTAAVLTGLAVAGPAGAGSAAAVRPEPCCPAGGPPAQPSVWPDPDQSAIPATDPPAGPTRAAPLPVCLIGSWRVTEEIYLVDFYTDVPAIPFRSSDRRFEFRPDGTGTISYEGMVGTASYQGDALRVEYDGSTEFRWSADQDTITYHETFSTSVSWRTFINSRQTNSGTERPDPDLNEVDDYRCSGGRVEERNDSLGYQATWVRTDGFGVYGR
jgi:hypothetical protein